ncbi:hypothetical protein ACWENR_07720 [Micromonospora sp. NPDC004336]
MPGDATERQARPGTNPPTGDATDRSGTPGGPPRTAPLRSVAAGCAVLAAVLVAAGWSGLLLVVGGRVVPGWALGGALLVVSWALLLFRRRVRASSPGPAATGRGPRWALTLLTVLTALGSALGGLNDLSTTYHVLTPDGPGGCRAVARETAFLFAGSGAVYEVGRVGIGRRVGSWTADDGYRPIAEGTYELTWGADGGMLTVSGRSSDPVWPALHEVGC